jgi:hypothetical protein
MERSDSKKNSSPFMEYRGSLPCSKQPATFCILSQMNVLCTPKYDFRKCHFNIILSRRIFCGYTYGHETYGHVPRTLYINAAVTYVGFGSNLGLLTGYNECDIYKLTFQTSSSKWPHFTSIFVIIIGFQTPTECL